MLIDPEFARELERLPPEGKSRRRSGARAGRDGGFPWRAGRKTEPRTRSRLERLFLNLFLPEGITLHLMVDASLSMTYTGFAPPVPSGKFEFARRLAAAIGYAALLRHDTVHIVGFAHSQGRRSPRLKGRKAIPLLLQHMESMRAGGNTNFASAIRNALARRERETIFLILSDFRNEHWDRGLPALLIGTPRIALLHLVDHSDLDSSPGESIQLVDASTGQSRGIDDSIERRRYRMRSDDELRRRLIDLARQNDFDYVPVPLDAPIEQMLLRSLGLREPS